MLKPETISWLAKEAIQKNDTAVVVDALMLDEALRRRLRDYHTKKREHEKQILEKTRELGLILAEIRKACPHLETTYYGDPSGGNDSETVCNLCGAEIRR